jgi:GDSL-like Lipase/Acylhydrolase family
MATSPLKQAFLLLSTASLALSSPTNLLGSTAARTDDEYPWVALGDSFSAGPGAGSPYDDVPDDCLRNNGAYPPQLNLDFSFPHPAMQFLSCTGHVVDDMIATQIPDTDVDQQVVTLSIGGNDLGFSKILKACVFKPGGPLSDDCDETIETARTYLEDKLEKTLRKGYDAIFNRITDDYKRKMFIQLYPNFFQEDTDWCNGQSMGIIPGYKPLLDNDLRKKLNSLGNDVRFAMKRIIARYSSDQHWFQTRMFYMDEFD